MSKHKKTGWVIASAVAAMFATGCGGTDASTDAQGSQAQGVQCWGINECAGEGECASNDGSHDCQGLNACAGQSWITIDTKEQCETEGGEVREA